MKSALFASRNPDFSALLRSCVLKVHWLVSRKNRLLSGATQACSQSPTNVNDHNCAQLSAYRRDDSYVTHGHSMSCWTQRSRHAATPRFQSIDQCWVYACRGVLPWVYCTR